MPHAIHALIIIKAWMAWVQLHFRQSLIKVPCERWLVSIIMSVTFIRYDLKAILPTPFRQIIIKFKIFNNRLIVVFTWTIPFKLFIKPIPDIILIKISDGFPCHKRILIEQIWQFFPYTIWIYWPKDHLGLIVAVDASAFCLPDRKPIPYTGKIHFQKVLTGRDFGDKVEILEGLKGDENLIINITDDLQDGQTVKYRKNETLTQG